MLSGQKTFIEGAYPVADLWTEYWGRVYEEHFRLHPGESRRIGFWDDQGNVIQAPPAVQERVAIRKKWSDYLEKQLTPDELARWRADEKLRRERAHQALGLAAAKKSQLQARNLMQVWRVEMEQLAMDAGCDQARQDKLMAALTPVERSYALYYRKRLDRVLPEWLLGDYILPLGKLEELEKRQGFTAYVPDITGAIKLARQELDGFLALFFTDAEKKLVEEKRRALEVRMDALAKQVAERVMDVHQQSKHEERDARIDRMARLIGFSDKRKKEWSDFLADGEKTAQEEFLSATRKTVREEIGRRIKQQDREDFIKQIEIGNWWFENTDAERLLNDFHERRWTLCLDSLLDAEELALWKKRQTEQKEELAQVWAQVCVSELDAALLLLPEQREKAEALVLDVTRQVARLPETLRPTMQHYSLDRTLMFAAGVGFAKISELLDKQQLARLDKIKGNHENSWRSVKVQIDKLNAKQEVER
jgi:hypothetical protein